MPCPSPARTHGRIQDNADDRSVHVALELSRTTGTLAFTDVGVRRPRGVAVVPGIVFVRD